MQNRRLLLGTFIAAASLCLFFLGERDAFGAVEMTVDAKAAQGVSHGADLVEMTAIPGTAWKMLIADVNADGTEDLIIGTYEMLVVCLDGKSRQITWTKKLEGVPLALVSVKNDKGKGADILISTGAYQLMRLNGQGQERWTQKTQDLCFAIAAGDLTHDGKTEIAVGGADTIIRILAGNGNPLLESPKQGRIIRAMAVRQMGNKQSELVVNIMFFGIQGFRVPNWEPLWRGDVLAVKNRNTQKRLKVKSTRYGLTNVTGTLLAADLDGDSVDEVIVGSRQNRITVFKDAGKIAWQAHLPFVYETSYSRWTWPQVSVVQQEKGAAPLIAATSYNQGICLYSARGEEVFAGRLKGSFYSFASPYSKDGKVYFGSRVPGDSHVYAIPGTQAGMKAIAAFEPASTSREVQENLAKLDKAISQQTIQPPIDRKDRIRHILNRPPPKNLHDISGLAQQYHQVSDIAGRNRVEIVFRINFSEDPADTNLPQILAPGQEQGLFSQKDIVKFAEMLEKEKVTFLLFGGHGSKPKLTLETIEAVFKAAPTRCIGVGFDEDNNMQLLSGFVSDHIVPLMEICTRYKDKHVMMREMRRWWCDIVQSKSISQQLFQARFRDVLIPIYKGNNPSSSEMNIGAILGLWKSGKVNTWGASILTDSLRWGHIVELSGACQPDQILRGETAMAAMGARVFWVELFHIQFRLTHGQDMLSRQYMGKADPSYEMVCFPFGNARRMLWQMAERGVLEKVSPEQVVVSPLGLQLEYQDTNNAVSLIHKPLDSPNPFSNVSWAMATTHPNYSGKILYHARTYFDTLYPTTPYGYFVFLPPSEADKNIPGITEKLSIKDQTIMENNRALEPQKAAQLLEKKAQEAAGRLPYSTPDAFLVIQQLGDSRDKLILVDPHMLGPKEVNAVVTAAVPLEGCRIRDILSNEIIPSEKNRFQCTVPAGGIRILEVTKVQKRNDEKQTCTIQGF